MAGVSPAIWQIERALFLARCHPLAPRWAGRAGRNSFITCAGKRAGAGAQAMAVLSTMLFAERVGLRYVHTPFTYIDGEGDVLRPGRPTPRIDPDAAELWERFFNFGDGELRAEDVETWPLERVPLNSALEFPFGIPNRFYSIRHCHDYANVFPDQYSRIVDRITQKYDAAAKDHLLSFDRSTLNIAVHVRRGDVGHAVNVDRYTSNERVAALVTRVAAVARDGDRPVAVHLYSEGARADFGPLQDMDIAFHLDEDPLASFHNLVRADILIMSKSTFAYVAALLSDGVAVYEPFTGSVLRHQPLSQWIVAGADLEFDRTRLRQTRVRPA